MQFIDLQTQYQKMKQEIDEAIQQVLNDSNYIMGQEVKLLEQRLEEYVNIKHCITCGNGTDALALALMAYGIGTGDAVFVPTFTFYASAETISRTGATPVFVDINEKTFNISPIDLKKAITEVNEEGKLRARAIVAVDLFGLPFDVKAIKEISKEHNLLLIEDAAQGFGGAIGGKKGCSFGDIAVTSFFPAKPLGCYGDGGAVFTEDDKVCDYVDSLRVHGKGNDKYDNIRVGLNSRLDTIQAAILLVKLKAFQEYELKARNKWASIYDTRLQHLVSTPHIPAGYLSSYAQYSILLNSEEKRNYLQNELKKRGVPSMIYYQKCLHEQTVYRNNPYIYRNFRNAESISKRILNLPMHPYLEGDIDEICKAIEQILEQ